MTSREAGLSRRSRKSMIAGALLFGGWLWMVGCSQEQGGTNVAHPSHDTEVQMASAPSETSRPVPEEYREGKQRFEALCARCHGLAGRGTHAGPPLVHKIYEPSHHADFAFRRAAAKGVRSHHWDFGDMPPVTDATPDDVMAIISFVRWLQREAGIT